jgi:hypothetical protein
VEAGLYVGRGARSCPMAKGENSGEENRERILRYFEGVFVEFLIRKKWPRSLLG